MLWRAYAKVNLALDIVGKRPDGLHEMDMLMVSAGLFDELSIEKIENSEKTRLFVNGDVPVENNLVIRAHALLEEISGKKLPCELRLCKNIPVAAGLGGGSADAAAALLGLNELFCLGFSQEFLAQASRPLGADVPFCVLGGAMRATGDGSRLTPVPVGQNDWHFVIHRPCEGLSTAQVFGNFSVHAPYPRPNMEGMLACLAAGDLAGLASHGANSLAPVAMRLRPQIEDAIQRLYDLGADYAAMSGSGPAVFGLFSCKESASNAAQALGVAAVPLMAVGAQKA